VRGSGALKMKKAPAGAFQGQGETGAAGLVRAQVVMNSKSIATPKATVA
jgi:hypothetical protein